MIAAIALLCLSAWQEPPKWEALLSYMHRDIRTEKGAHEVWQLKGVSRDGEKAEAELRRWMDGKRYRQEIESGGVVEMATASNGTKTWTIVRPSGFYVQHDTFFDSFSETWKGLPKPATDEPKMNVGFSNAYDVVINVHPLPVITKIEDADGERRVYAEVKMPDRTMTLLLRFEREKWLLKELHGKSSEGAAALSFKRVKSLRNETFGPDRFALDTKLAEGLRELTGEDRERFIKSLQGDD